MGKAKPILELLEQLNSECFRYDNWEANWWGALDLDYSKACDDKEIMRVVRKYAVGYCDSSKVRMRPRDNSYAVMFSRNGEEFWCHILKETLENKI